MEWLYVSPSIHHRASVISTSWSLLFSPHRNCSHENILQSIPDVASSLCKYFFMYLYEDGSCLQGSYNSIIRPEKFAIMLPHQMPRKCGDCHGTVFLLCVWTRTMICQHIHYWLYGDGLYLCDGQHTLQSSPVCVWMVAPFASSPCLLRLPDTAHGLLLRPGSDLMPHDSCIAVTWQPDSPISGRKLLDSTVSS